MPWLDKLDAKTQHWPTPLRWGYQALKWYLVVMGGFALLRLWLDRTGLWPFY